MKDNVKSGKKPIKWKKVIETSIFLLIFFAFFVGLSIPMGVENMFGTFMQTAYHLLLETVLYICAICVMTGAISKLFVEFGVVSLLEKLLRPLMKPIFNLPGVASLGAVMTFLSDNPAIITLSKDKSFARYFKKFQMVSLTNFGTAFGMGLVVICVMISFGYGKGALVGLFGAVCGSIISTRLMQYFTIKAYPELKAQALTDEEIASIEEKQEGDNTDEPKKGAFLRFLDSILDGGKDGVAIGVAIIPGVLVISTMVMMLTFGPAGNDYSGAAYEGYPALPWLADKVDFIFKWLFGFEHPELIAFPITSLGAVGAALGLVPGFIAKGIIDANAIAVFTAMGMCWSGFLSTHTAMLDSMGYRKLISKAILSHTIAGLCAGIIAHWTMVLIQLI
ncbi:MAG: hypothetical protein HUK15_08950 [Bacteroidales bacterium]|nr:hypothetical protein [Bacteroidales bacterium]